MVAKCHHVCSSLTRVSQMCNLCAKFLLNAGAAVAGAAGWECHMIQTCMRMVITLITIHTTLSLFPSVNLSDIIVYASGHRDLFSWNSACGTYIRPASEKCLSCCEHVSLSTHAHTCTLKQKPRLPLLQQLMTVFNVNPELGRKCILCLAGTWGEEAALNRAAGTTNYAFDGKVTGSDMRDVWRSGLLRCAPDFFSDTQLWLAANVSSRVSLVLLLNEVVCVHVGSGDIPQISRIVKDFVKLMVEITLRFSSLSRNKVS